MVVLLMATGAALTIVQAGSLSALVASAWGAILAANLILVAVLLALAAWNRLVLTPALAARQAEAPRRLNRSIRAEILLGIAILAVASAFRLTPPPRIPGPVASVHANIPGADMMADVTLQPGRAGQNVVILSFMDGEMNAFAPQDVRLRFFDATRGIGPIEAPAEVSPDGQWRSGPITLPGTGPCDLTLDVLISDFAKTSLSGRVELGP